MNEVRLIDENISRDQVEAALGSWLDGLGSKPEKVLLIPPDTKQNSKQQQKKGYGYSPEPRQKA